MSEQSPRQHPESTGPSRYPELQRPEATARAGVQSPPSTRDSTAFPISMAARSTSELESVAAKAVAMAAPPVSHGCGRGAASESIASQQARGSNFLEERRGGRSRRT